ncbi:MAG TPA: hypothetical protein VIK59_12275 [Verrucomicrobiae bacterium]
MSTPTDEKKTRARKWVNGYTVAGTAVVIAAIIPGTTSTALAAMEAHMCYAIGKIYKGENYTMKEAVAVARIVGLVAIAAPMVALEAMNAIPVAGWAVKGTIAGGVIKTLGEAIIARYEKMEREGADITITDMPPVLESPALAPDALHKMLTPPPAIPPKIPATSGHSVDDRLQKITDLFGKKLISQAEYDAKRQQILGEL